MAEKRPLDDRELEAHFAAARDAAPKLSEDLAARIVADAEAQIAASAAPVARRHGRIRALLEAVGGWPAAAGLATAAVAGLAIGLATPDTLDDLTGGYMATATGYGLDDLMPSYGDLLGEG